MNFLAPLFLAAAFAVAGPIIFHLIRRTTRDRAIFSSLMFLSPTPPRLTRRSRLEHLFLLALRCAVLGLLAAAFARPFFKQTTAETTLNAGPRRTVVLLDTSASMRRSGLWNAAQQRANEVARRATPADEVAVFAFDRQTRPLVTFADWRNTPVGDRAGFVNQKLSTLSPGWAATRAGQALITAAELLSEAAPKDSTTQNEVVLVSDLQESSRIEAVQSYQWPKNLKLSVVALSAKPASNASLQWLTDSPEIASNTTAQAQLRLRVNNPADSKREQFKLTWSSDVADVAGEVRRRTPTNSILDVYVPSGQSRTVTLPNLALGSNQLRITLSGDDEEFDNVVHATVPERARVSVAYIGAEPVSDPKQPLFFLEKALQDTRRQEVQLITQAPSAVSAAAISNANLIALAGPVSMEAAALIRERVSNGGTALVAINNAQAMAPTLAALVGKARVVLDEAPASRYAILSEIDFRHPLFAPFADPRYSDFSKIRFWRYRRLNVPESELSGARVLARFDTGDPALLEVPTGKGRYFVLTSGWDPEDSQFALSTKFVPFVYTLLEQAGTPLAPPAQFVVGDTVDLASLLSGKSRETIVRGPGAETRLGAAATFAGAEVPGVYEIISGPERTRFAVNLDPAESRLAPVALEELERLGLPLNLASEAAVVRERQRLVNLKNSEFENRQKLWRWFILGTLGLLLIETVAAGRAARANVVQPANP